MLRLRTKEDVDRHAQQVLRKLMTDAERKQKFFQFAQLYMKLNEYESARRSLLTYLSQRADSAPGHKLLGQALEGLGLLGQAVAAYETSLKYDSRQASLLYKVCELYLNKDVPFDPEKARTALEKAQHAYPHDPVIFSLKEKIMGASNDSVNAEEFEKMLLAEVKARPNDVNIRIKLLKLYISKGRVDLAYSNAVNTESKKIFNSELAWYQCLDFICECYKKQFPAKCNWEFYMIWLFSLDQTCCHNLHERKALETKDSTCKALFKFDKVLYQGSRVKSNVEVYADFINHMSGQLVYHMAVELIQKAKADPGSWSDVKSSVSVLLLLATNWTSGLDSVATLMHLNESLRKSIALIHHHAKSRLCQAGYTLISLSQESQSKKHFIDKINFFASGQWKNQIYQKLFSSIKDQESQQSHFILSPIFKDVPQKFPSEVDLKPTQFVESFEVPYNNCLEPLIWVGLHAVTNIGGDIVIKEFYSKSYSSINFTSGNLSNCSVETLNQLDIDSFLYCTIFLVHNNMEERKANGILAFDRPINLPSEVSDYFIPEDVLKWWTLALKMTCGNLKQLGDGEKLTKNRFNLMQGLEDLRGGQLPLSLLIALARTFSLRAEFEKDESRKDGCEKRALHLWDQAVISLKGFSNKIVTSNYKKRSLFSIYPIKNYSTDEVNRLLDEGRYFIGCHYLKIRLLEKALDIFKTISTPEALFKQATIYEMMACDVSGSLRGDELTSELRSREAVLASKARECLRRATDALSDLHHPLASAISAKAADIDTLLCRIEPDNGIHDGNGLNLSMESLSIGSGDSPPATPRYRLNTSKQFPASTPKAMDYSSRINPLPSVDVADLINSYQNTNNMKLQQMTEQARLILDRLDNIHFEQRTQRNLFDDLSNKISKLETELRTGLTDMRKELKKPPESFNVLDDEEYSEDVVQYPTVNPYFAAARGLQNPSALYGTPMPQYFSPNQIYPGGFYGLPQGAGSIGDAPQLTDLLRGGPAAGALRSMPAPLGLQQSMVVPGIMPGLGLGAQLQTSVGQLSSAPNIPLPAHLATSIAPTVLPKPQQQPLGPNNVVITTSDTLPTTVPSSSPILSVTIPPEHRLGTPSQAPLLPTPCTPGLAVPHNFQIPMPSNFKLVEKSPLQATSNDDIEGELDVYAEHDPLPNFKPIIPLPDEVEVHTGEENEKVLFNEYAKLYRFVEKSNIGIAASSPSSTLKAEKEWKERGAGPLKILKNEENGKYRILMRRENLHKICANHFITKELELTPYSNSGKAWIWWAPDYSDEKVQCELLVAKFKSETESELFKSTIDKLKAEMETDSTSTPNSSFVIPLKSDSPVNAVTITKKLTPSVEKSNIGIAASSPSSTLKAVQSQSKPGSNLDKNVKLGCTPILSPPKLSTDSHVSNSGIETNKTGSIVVGGITFSSPPKPLPERTEKIKETQQKPNVFSNFSFEPSSDISKFSYGQPKFCTSTTTFALSSPTSTTVTNSFRPLAPKIDTQTKLVSPKPPAGSWECSCYVTNKSDATKCIACDAPMKKPLSASIIKSTHRPPASSSLPPLTKQTVPGQWSCSDCYVTNQPGSERCCACGGLNPSGSVTQSTTSSITTPKFSFGIPNVSVSAAVPVPTVTVANTKPTSHGFSLEVGNGSVVTSSIGTTHTAAEVFTFGVSAPPLLSSGTSTFGSRKFSFTMSTPAVPSPKNETISSPGLTLDDSNELAPEDDEHMKGIHFEPVVALPDKVDVKTGEEEEEVLYSHRAKLFRYDNNPKACEWKERGVGDIKILKHIKTGKLRLLMRREPIMKLCLNHYITPDIEMKQKDNKSWFWCAADFSDGDVQKIKEAVQSFSIRFKTPDIADGFKEEFDKAQKEVREKGVNSQKGSGSSISRPSEPVEGKETEPDLSNNDDVIFLSENQVSEELRAKAVALKLPPKFFAYLDCPPCPGCRGCETEDDEEVVRSEVIFNLSSTGTFNLKPSVLNSSFGTSGGPFFKSDGTFSMSSTPVNKISNIFSGTSIFGAITKGAGDTSNTGTPKAVDNSLYCGTPKGGGDTPLYVGSPNASVFGGSQNSSKLDTSKLSETPTPSFSSAPKFGRSLFSGDTIFGTPANQISSMGFSFGSVPPKPVEQSKAVEVSQPPSAMSTFTFSAVPLMAASTTPTPATTSQTVPATSTIVSMTAAESKVKSNELKDKSLDSSETINTTPTSPLFGSKMDELSFATIASTNAKPAFKKSIDFKWEGAGASVFGSPLSKTLDKSGKVDETSNNKSIGEEDDEEEGANDGEEHDPHFEPIIPLPNKIDLKTGEEDEDIVFTERCKLYLLDQDNKEWKERGVGNIKLLKHRNTGAYRLLMRREQVHKLVLNHLLTPSISINPMKSSTTSWCWCAMNLSQGITEPQKEFLSVRFKDKKLSDGFKAAIDAALCELNAK